MASQSGAGPTERCCSDERTAWETIDGSMQQVCLSCGAVSNVESYVNDGGGAGTTFTFASGRSVATNDRLAPQRQKISRGVLEGLRRIRALCAVLQCDDALKRECEAAYQSALAHDALRCKSLALKDAVAAACVYLKMRQRDLPVTLTSVANLVPPRNAFELGAALKTIVGVLGIRAPPLDTADVVRAALAASPRFAAAEDVAKVTRLVELLRDLWVAAGRRHNTVILAAAFVYDRLQRKPPRAPSLKLGAFVRQFGAYASRQQVGRVAREAESVLLQCCARLPWMRGVPMDMRAVRNNLDQIFQFKWSVLRRDGAEEGFTAAAQTCSPDDGDVSEEQGDEGIVSDEQLATALDRCQQLGADVEARLSGMDDPVLGESDIPESELGKFIRSPAEASAFATAEATLDSAATSELEKWMAVESIRVSRRKRKADSADQMPSEAAG